MSSDYAFNTQHFLNSQWHYARTCVSRSCAEKDRFLRHFITLYTLPLEVSELQNGKSPTLGRQCSLLGGDPLNGPKLLGAPGSGGRGRLAAAVPEAEQDAREAEERDERRAHRGPRGRGAAVREVRRLSVSERKRERELGGSDVSRWSGWPAGQGGRGRGSATTTSRIVTVPLWNTTCTQKIRKKRFPVLLWGALMSRFLHQIRRFGDQAR